MCIHNTIDLFLWIAMCDFQEGILKKINNGRNAKTTCNIQEGLPFNIAADFGMVNDNWKQSAPKKVVSRYIVVFCCVCTVFAGEPFITI